MTKIWQVWEDLYNNDGQLKFFNVKFEGSESECKKFAKKNKGKGLHVGYGSAHSFFNDSGFFTGELPQACIDECSMSGPVDEYVKDWTLELEFMIPSLDMGRKYLSEFGAWDDLDQCDGFQLSQRILWIACGDMKEEGEWFGLVH